MKTHWIKLIWPWLISIRSVRFLRTQVCKRTSYCHINTPCPITASFLIQQFGALNGLCSSITESKHIKAVKEPWHCSSCNKLPGQIIH
ncbi:hypothetical protein EDB83DRAFT_2230010 [Lactarius deliciosus]|nr:hypothetical protein EDB83DRAFT_2230010 [Lactarius deliciosus]